MMDIPALTFGARVALALLLIGVVIGFSAPMWRFLWGSPVAGDRLGAGLFLIAMGAIVGNGLQLAALILGLRAVGPIFRGQPFMLFGLIIATLGYFLNFTAWFSTVTQKPQRFIATVTVLTLAFFGLVGAGWFLAR